MAKKTTLKINLAQIDKNRIRTYKLKDGTEVKEYSVDLVETDSTKVITKADGTPVAGDTWRLEKVGFVCNTPTKEERAKAKENGDKFVDTQIIGNAERFVDYQSPREDNHASQEVKGEDDYGDSINPDSIPF